MLRRSCLTIALLAAAAAAQAPQTHSAAANFSADILGEYDTRPDTWGRAGAASWKITFKPPAGKRVRILRAYGDFLIWPIGKVEDGKFAGALFGLQTTAPEGSVRADLAADNTFLYLQTATGGKPERIAFDHVTRDGGLLGPDHVLVVKVAAWLNDTERPIHMEPSFTVVYRFEEAQP